MSAPPGACRRCLKVFVPTGDDPAVSATSLGAGIYHLRCARLTWRDQADRTRQKTEARTDRRQAGGRRLAQWRAKLDAEIAARTESTESEP